MDQCPKCGRFTLQYDSLRREFRCGWRECGHSELRLERLPRPVHPAVLAEEPAPPPADESGRRR